MEVLWIVKYYNYGLWANIWLKLEGRQEINCSCIIIVKGNKYKEIF